MQVAARIEVLETTGSFRRAGGDLVAERVHRSDSEWICRWQRTGDREDRMSQQTEHSQAADTDDAHADAGRHDPRSPGCLGPAAIPAASSLHQAIGHRHSNRGPYRAQPVPAGVLSALARLADGLSGTQVRWFTGPLERARLGALLLDAANAIIADRQRASLGCPAAFGPLLQAVLARPDRQVLATFRVGYPVRATRLSPRRPVEDVIR
jgi:hypothetical protein